MNINTNEWRVFTKNGSLFIENLQNKERHLIHHSGFDPNIFIRASYQEFNSICANSFFHSKLITINEIH